MHERWKLLVSAVIDGEASEAEREELKAHIKECPECAALLKAYRAVGDELREVDPPEKLASGVMYRIKYVKKHRFAFGRFSAIAAAAIIIVVAGSIFLKNNSTETNARKAAVSYAETESFYSESFALANDSAEAPESIEHAEADYANAYDAEPAVAPTPAPEHNDTFAAIVSGDQSYYSTLTALAEGRTDIAAICVAAKEPEAVKDLVRNSIPGGVWFEAPASLLETEEFDTIIYLNSAGDKCIIAVYYD